MMFPCQPRLSVYAIANQMLAYNLQSVSYLNEIQHVGYKNRVQIRLNPLQNRKTWISVSVTKSKVKEIIAAEGSILISTVIL